MSRAKIEYYVRAFLFLAISLTVLFIWSNSAATPVKSAATSNRVAEIIREIIPDGRVQNFFVTYIRKIAHFTEYSMLAIEVSVLIIFIRRGAVLLRFSLSLLFGLAVALCDEGIQAFTGRGNSMMDVAIDMGGYFLFSLIALISLAVILYFTRRKNA